MKRFAGSSFILLAGLLMSVWASVGYAAEPSEVLQELRSSLFEQANAALKSANDAKANKLSPDNYAAGAEAYRDAETTLNRGGSIESIRRALSRATESFLAAADQAALAAKTFEAVLNARDDAWSAGAESYASEEWTRAEATFMEATVRLENGRIDRAQRDGSSAENLFRSAELIAIKANYLSETRELLERADKENAPRYAPKSFNSATRLLKEAESTLENNRYDTDQPRSLARQAKHDALHAIYVAGLEQAIRKKNTTLEDILLQWEASITTLADLYDLPVHFDDGERQAVNEIRMRIADSLKDNQELKARLEDRQAQLDTLIQETASMERLSKLVARQERQKERLAKVEALFSEDEAIVLRQQDSIILRMIGLNFDTAQSELQPDHEVLLSSLRRAINEFPESSIVVEGHTDSFGSDTNNQVLSQKRADAVYQYLLSNTPVSPANLTALGYGESRPVANNETEDGRRRNRRIDVVIYPKW